MQTQSSGPGEQPGRGAKGTETFAGTLGNEHLIHEAEPQPQKTGRSHG